VEYFNESNIWLKEKYVRPLSVKAIFGKIRFMAMGVFHQKLRMEIFIRYTQNLKEIN
jgi:hypothetical protein